MDKAEQVFEKLAFNIAQQNKLLRVIKPKVTKGGAKVVRSMMGDVAGVTNKKSVKRSLKQISEDQRAEVRDAMKTMGMKSLAGRIIAPKKGDMTKAVLKHLDKNLPATHTKGVMKSIRGLKPKDRRSFNSVLGGHELAEAKSKGGAMNFSAMFSHNSPSVLLKEHNMVTTMKNPKVRTTMKKLRSIQGEGKFISDSFPGYSHGKSPRLSRHAIKRMSTVLERKGKKALEDAAGFSFK